MLRELQVSEQGHVSGGDIVVTGNPGMPEWQLQSILDRMKSSSMIDLGIKFEGSGGSGNWVDTDGDGVPDSPEIVVIANKVQLEGGYYAYIANGQYVMHFDGWFSDHYVGTFVPGTEQNHNLVTKDPIFKLFGEWRGVKIGGEAQPNAGEYWIRVQ